MNTIRRWFWVSGLGLTGLLVFQLLSGQVFAETVELVTYYPAPGGENLHAQSLTVGTDYAGETPNDGEALVFRRVWIGDGFNAAGVRDWSLQVVGQNDAFSKVVFVPGQNVVAGAPFPSMFVGIGTTNPQQLLHVRQDQGDEAYVLVEGTGVADGNFSGLELRSVEAVPRVWQLGHKRENSAGIADRNDFQIAYRDESNNWFRRLTIKNNGNVGIGVNNADQSKLHIQESTSGIWGIRIANRDNSRNWVIGVDSVTVGDGKFWIGDVTVGAGRFGIDTVGNVGIGTPNPTGVASPGNGVTTGNLDVNDIWLRSVNHWASQVTRTSSYTGNGVAATQAFNIGFTPKAVTLISPTGPLHIVKFDSIPTNNAFVTQPAGVSYGNAGITIVANGFQVTGTSNQNTVIYYFSATS